MTTNAAINRKQYLLDTHTHTTETRISKMLNRSRIDDNVKKGIVLLPPTEKQKRASVVDDNDQRKWCDAASRQTSRL